MIKAMKNILILLAVVGLGAAIIVLAFVFGFIFWTNSFQPWGKIFAMCWWAAWGCGAGAFLLQWALNIKKRLAKEKRDSDTGPDTD